MHRISSSQRAVLWPILIAALIFAASTRSRLAGPSVEGIDKVTHFAVYGLLATLVVRNGRGARAAWWSIVVVSLYGISDEWHQSFTPGRSVEFADWLADTMGAALAVSLYTWWPRYRALLERPLGAQRRIEKRAGVQSLSTP